jgi:hypothetical protein
MANKSVSLFEILPPSSKGQKGPVVAEESKIHVSPEAAHPAPREAAPKVENHSPKYGATAASHDLDGVSVRKKDDHFGLIITCMLICCVVTFFAGYNIGKRKGANEALSTLQTSGAFQLPVTSVEKANIEVHKPQVSSPVEVLPTSLRTLNQEQSVAVSAPVAPKTFTLQVQTLGRNQKDNIDDLVNKLKAAGFDAYADHSDGAVFVGRLETSRGSEAEQLKNAVSRFNWRQRDFSGAYFRRSPRRLSEN